MFSRSPLRSLPNALRLYSSSEKTSKTGPRLNPSLRQRIRVPPRVINSCFGFRRPTRWSTTSVSTVGQFRNSLTESRKRCMSSRGDARGDGGS